MDIHMYIIIVYKEKNINAILHCGYHTLICKQKTCCQLNKFTVNHDTVDKLFLVSGLTKSFKN